MSTAPTEFNVESQEVIQELEKAWANVFKIVNHFLSEHDQYGFHLIEQKINPKIEDLLLSLRMMGAILDLLDGLPEVDARMLINAKQQVLLFEQATLSLKAKDKEEYDRIVVRMRAQAQF